MPLKSYVCTDGVRVSVEECLRGCRLPRRCLTLTTLRVIALRERVWDGAVHVTDLLGGVMQTYLKITQGYAIHPQDRAFVLLGSGHHKMLEDGRVGEELIEPKLTYTLPGEITLQGSCDVVEHENGEWVLSDFKTWGSYKVAKVLGVEKQGGGRGKPPVTFTIKPGLSDMRDEELQVNMYRVMLERAGLEVGRMQIQVTVRDGGIAAAKSRGVDANIYVIPVKKLSDVEVVGYFTAKGAELHQMLRTGESYPCTGEERWGGTKCRFYCEVAEFCPMGEGEK
jgi:hypothetical protein